MQVAARSRREITGAFVIDRLSLGEGGNNLSNVVRRRMAYPGRVVYT
jgi:hypothetical protein